jgi:hypothetical protein
MPVYFSVILTIGSSVVEYKRQVSGSLCKYHDHIIFYDTTFILYAIVSRSITT